MNFFKSIEKHLEGLNLSIVIAKHGDKLAVSVLPQPTCEDKAKENISPLLLTGTANELDLEFVTVIQSPLEKVSGITSNILQFEGSVKKMEAESKIKDAAKKEKEEAGKKSDKKLVTAKKWLDKKDYTKALKYVDEALALCDDHKASIEMKKEILEADPSLKPVQQLDLVEESKKAEKIQSTEKPTESKKEDKAKDVDDIANEVNLVEQSEAKVKKALPIAESGKYDEALALINEALEICPTHDRAINAKKKLIDLIAKRDKVPAEKHETVVKADAYIDKAKENVIEGKWDQAKLNTETALKYVKGYAPAIELLRKIELHLENDKPTEESQVNENNQLTKLKGAEKPTRNDFESIADFEARIVAWEKENIPTEEKNPAVKKSQIQIITEKSNEAIVTGVSSSKKEEVDPVQEAEEEKWKIREQEFEAEGKGETPLPKATKETIVTEDIPAPEEDEDDDDFGGW